MRVRTSERMSPAISASLSAIDWPWQTRQRRVSISLRASASFAGSAIWRLAYGAGGRFESAKDGTATSSAALARSGADVVGCDFSLGMLRVGRRAGHEGVELVAGDALRLPFRDGAFDAVTISFGLRNTDDPDLALRELLRVTRPGGRLVVCEFSHPVLRPLRTVYDEYLMRALPAVARRVSSDPAAYEYLAESIRAWPDQPALAARLQAAGWSSVAWRDLTGGIVALHRGTRPA